MTVVILQIVKRQGFCGLGEGALGVGEGLERLASKKSKKRYRYDNPIER